MSILKFLPGIVLVQAATAILVYATLETPSSNWRLYALLALIAGFLAAFWFASIADHIKKDAIARLKEKLIREREQLFASTEKEKRQVFEQTHKRIVKETNRAHAKANFKVGAVVIGAAGVGVGLLSLQFITIGLIALLTSGGVLTGYAVRAYRGALTNKGKAAKTAIAQRKPTTLIEGKASEPPAPPGLNKEP